MQCVLIHQVDDPDFPVRVYICPSLEAARDAARAIVIKELTEENGYLTAERIGEDEWRELAGFALDHEKFSGMMQFHNDGDEKLTIVDEDLIPPVLTQELHGTLAKQLEDQVNDDEEDEG